jgi:hypothetical protein
MANNLAPRYSPRAWMMALTRSANTSRLAVGERLAPPQPEPQGEAERAWAHWLAQGCVGPQPAMPLDPGTRTMQDLFRRQMAEARAKAALVDPTTHLRFGHLPGPGK